MFDDLHDPNPPTAGLHTLAAVSAKAQQLRRRRSLLMGGGGVALVALAIAAIVLPGRNDERLVSIDEPTTDSSTTINAEPTPFTGPTPSTDSPVTGSSSPDACRDVSSSPVWLVDGTSPGDAAIETAADGSSVARWGVGDTVSVAQVAPQPDAAYFDAVEGTDQLVTSGSVRAAVVMVAGSAASSTTSTPVISITIDDGDCERQYVVGPGLELEQGIAYAQDWVDALYVDASSTESRNVSSVCVSARAFDLSQCSTIDIGTTMGSVSWEPVAGTSLSLVAAVVVEGAFLTMPSSLARSEPIPGTPDFHLVDLIRSEPCAGVQFPDGSTVPVGPACTDADAVPSPTVTRPMVAIDGNGDAVVFDQANVPRVVFDGTDPDDPLPLEGEVTSLDGVAATDGGATAIVGICCEPVPGSLVSVDLASGAEDYIGFGRLPAVTRFGNLVWATLGSDESNDIVPAVVVGDADGRQAATLQTFPLDSRIVDLAVVPEPSGLGDAVLVLLATSDRVELWRLLAGGGDMFMSTTISDVAWTEDAGLSLAGYSAASFFVLDEANDRLLEFDGLTFNPVVTPDGKFLAISLWITPETRREVTPDRRLLIDGILVPGEYLWVR